MSIVSAIALSGVKAADLRLQAGASNIANVRSNGPLPDAANPTGQPAAYTPVDVQQTPLATGGVTANLAPASRDALLSYDPGAPYANANGLVATPNVDLVDEMLQLITAKYSLAANMSVIEADSEMARTALATLR